MAFTIKAIRGLLELEDRWTAKLTEAANKTTAFAASMEQKLDKIGSKFTAAGGTLTAGITAPILGVAIASLKLANDFEGVMNRVEAAMGKPDPATMIRLRTAAQDMGAATVFSSTEAAEALIELGKAGLDSEKSIAALPSVLQLAVAGQLSMAEAATMASNTMATFGINSEGMAKANDIIAKAAASSTIDVRDLADSFKFVGPVAAATGVSLTEVASAAALLGTSGIRGEMAGTALRGIMTELMAPTKKQAELMKDLGLQNAFAGGEMMSYVDILKVLEGQGNVSADVMQLFGARAGPAMLAMLKQGSGALDEMNQKLIASDGYAQMVADTYMKGLPGALERAKGSLETMGVAIGSLLVPALEAAANWTEKVANYVTKHIVPAFAAIPKPVQIVIGVLLAVAAAIGPLLMAFGLMASGLSSIIAILPYLGTAFTFLTGPIGLTILAVAALAAVWYTWGDDIKGVVTSTYGVVKEYLWDKFNGSIAQKLMNLLIEIGKAWWQAHVLVGTVVKAIYGIVKVWLLDKLQPAFEWLANVWSYVTGAWETASNAITGFVSAIYNSIKTWLLDKFEWIIGKVGAGIDKLTGWFKKFRESMGSIEVAVPGQPGATPAPLPTPPPAPKPPVVIPPAALTPGGSDRVKLSDDEKKAAKELAEALKDIRLAQVALTESQKASITSLLTLGISQSTIAKSLQISEVAVKNYAEGIEAAEKSEEKWTETRKDWVAKSRQLSQGFADDFIKDQRKMADASADALVDQLKSSKEFHVKNEQIGMSTHQKELARIEASRVAAVNALTKQSNVRGALYDQATGEINQFYQHETDIANRTSETIVERMQLAGVQTRADLELSAVAAEEDYANMLLYSDQFTTADIENSRLRAKGARDATKETKTDWTATIASMAGSFATLDTEFSKSWGGIISQIATGVDELMKFDAAAFQAMSRGQQAAAIAQGAVATWNATGGGQSKGRAALGGALAGAKTGAMIGSIIPGFGTVAGAAVGAAAGAILGLVRGVTDYQKRVRAAAAEMATMRAEAEKLSGGAEKMGAQFKFLGMDIEGAFKNGDPAAVKKMLEEGYGKLRDINENLVKLSTNAVGAGKTLDSSLRPYIEQLRTAGILTDEAAAKLLALTEGNSMGWREMQSLAEKYGVSLAALGPTFQQQKLTETAGEIIDAFNRLVDNGADYQGVLAGMTDEINQVVNDSIKFGTEIPGNMKPWIEELMRTGKLMDDTGTKITGIDNLKFGPEVKSDIEDLTAAIQDLVKTMTDNLGGALDALGRRRVDIPVTYRVTNPEAVTPPGASGIQSREPNGQPKSMTVNVNVDGKTVARSVLPHLPDELELNTV